jgi:hypothetical protein
MTDQVTYTCNDCGDSSDNLGDFTELSDHLYCDDCSICCDRCGERCAREYTWVEDVGSRYCDDCYSGYASYCEGCEASYCDTSFHNVIGRSNDYCSYCCDNNYNFCQRCDNYYEDECRCRSGNINDYSYKPSPIFHGSSQYNLYFGMEIETEIWNGFDDASSEASGSDDDFYLKHDSSIGGNYPGFEIVSHPYSFQAWHDKANPILNYVDNIRDNYKARSWDAKSSCGIHIHISRTGFTSGSHTHRFLGFIYSNPVPLSKLGGRKGSKYASFSDVYKFDDYGRPYKDIQSKLKAGWNSDRYSAVNTNNPDTLELRWFQGTLKRSGILAHIQLAHAMVEYTRYMTVAQVRDGAFRWDRFTYYVADNLHIYPDLHAKILRLDSISISNNRPTQNA